MKFVDCRVDKLIIFDMLDLNGAWRPPNASSAPSSWLISSKKKTFNHLLCGCHQIVNWIEASAIIYRCDFWSRNLSFSPKTRKLIWKQKKNSLKMYAITKLISCCQTFPTIANKRGKKAKVNIIRLKDHFQFSTLAMPSRSRIDV